MLSAYGWDPTRAADLPPGTEPGRVLSSIRNHCIVVTDDGERRAEPTGNLRFTAADGGLPVAGDWVALALGGNSESGEAPTGGAPAAIVAVLPRRTAVVRRVAGARTRRDGGVSSSQVLAANVDTVIICTSLPLDVNLRRIERYLATVWESGAAPVIAVTKGDTVSPAELARTLDDVRGIASGAR